MILENSIVETALWIILCFPSTVPDSGFDIILEHQCGVAADVASMCEIPVNLSIQHEKVFCKPLEFHGDASKVHILPNKPIPESLLRVSSLKSGKTDAVS